MAPKQKDDSQEPPPIPTYRIDLSHPPAERYKQLATDFAPKMQELTPLFDEVLSIVFPYRFMRRFVEFLASIFLFRLYSSEETQEIRGIAKAAGVGVYFLVALNVLLDSLLGCTSGGVLTKPKGTGKQDSEQSRRMMHFRTLDWGMDGLRSVLVVLEFVRSDSREPEKVIARSISYAGFVGVLTGVRQDLSLSLNFRPNHNCSSLSLRWHQLMVIFGVRTSISSLLRSILYAHSSEPLPALANTMANKRSAPCYIVFNDGKQSTVIEKDLTDGIIRTATDFIAHTNHDISSTSPERQAESKIILGLEAFIEDSEDRQNCITKKWGRWIKKEEKRGEERQRAVREETVISWVKAYPTMNECSHFACLLDPGTASIHWVERGTMTEDDVEENDRVAAREEVLYGETHS